MTGFLKIMIIMTSLTDAEFSIYYSPEFKNLYMCQLYIDNDVDKKDGYNYNCALTDFGETDFLETDFE